MSSTEGHSGWPDNKVCPACGSYWGQSDGKTMEQVNWEDKTGKEFDVESQCLNCGWKGMESQLIDKQTIIKMQRSGGYWDNGKWHSAEDQTKK